MDIQTMAQICLFSPLLGAVFARFVKKPILAQLSTIGFMTISLMMALALFRDVAYIGNAIDLYQYTWLDIGRYQVAVGFWLDALSLLMIVIVTAVSWLVHIYSIGYMQDDHNQCAYFSYVSFFTFAMLLLVMANNLVTLFFGWEGVGVASYLLIGFWQTKTYPASASIKAFLVNRMGDIGLLVAMGFIMVQQGSIAYGDILSIGLNIVDVTLYGYRLVDWVCVGLLIAAMGKSAQVPLHVWLPDSMAGPTPISALIHAATMVTAGIYLICRFSPWFELAPMIQMAIVFIGFVTMILMGLVALVEYDIKKVIAYSTLSQLGMMIGMCGVSGYVFSIFHLATHAAFKALLFLAAGAVIIASHHEQDLRKIGGLRYHRSIHISMLIGLVSMVALPPTSGFFSKDAMLLFLSEAVNQQMYTVLLLGAVITALYSTRLYYLLFWQNNQAYRLEYVPVSVRIPLWVLIIFSVMLGYWLVEFMPVLADTLQPSNLVVKQVIAEMQNTSDFINHALSSFSLTLISFTVVLSFYVMYKRPSIIDKITTRFSPIYSIIVNQYGFNALYERYLVMSYSGLTKFLWQKIDHYLIDYTMVLGVARRVFNISSALRISANGQLHHYIFMMLFALVLLLIGVL